MSSLPEHVARLVDATRILPKRSRVLVAVSGGVDSMVLLHVLHGLAPARKWTLVAAHLNHRLRGRSSDADARFVEAECKRLQLSFVMGRQEVKSVAKRHKVSIEMAAREVRHKFLVQAARRRTCAVVALAHHADDQAELVLMRLLRGSGSEGLGGMSISGPSPADPGMGLVRPLLEVTGEQIAAHAREAGIRFREDRSNTDPRFLRNRVRHELLPLLRRKYQPAIDRVLTRTASILSAEADWIHDQASAWLRRETRSFNRLPLALKRRVIQLQAIEIGVAMDFETCEQLVGGAGRSVNAAGGEVLRRDACGRLARVQTRSLSHSDATSKLTLTRSGRTPFAGATFSWRVVAAGKTGRLRSGPHTEVFDADRVGGTILLRHWRAGDRFQPIGMRTAVKLQDLFTNQKVSRVERRKRVVAESAEGEIFWVEGMRIGEPFKLSPNTRKSLVWRWNC